MAGIIIGHPAFTSQRVGGKWEGLVGGDVAFCFSRECRLCSSVWYGGDDSQLDGGEGQAHVVIEGG